MSIIVSYCQHCDEQQFQTLLCVHYTIFSVVKLDLFIRALLQDRILALEKTTRTPRFAFKVSTFRTSPSFVEITLERGSNRSPKSIDLKIVLNMESWVIYVRKERFLEIRIASCKFMQFAIVCK